MISGFRAAISAAFLIAPFATANAAIVTDHISVSLAPSAFTSYSGPKLTSAISLSFDLTFDPTVATTNSPAVYSNLHYQNFVLDYPLSYDVTAVAGGGLPAGTLIVGGSNDGAGEFPDTFNTNDFYLHITDIAGTPTFQQFGFSQAPNSYYFTPTGEGTPGVTLDVAPTSVSSVPLPSTLPMFGAAVLAMAAARVFMRKRSGSASHLIAG